ncbi:DUF1501 domain-containing protein [Aliiglaciecola lipolytica]|uniref:DUF1501 domain-containing protein n=1 Tax=Aliiglaciecola lipolytica E3 TaxID=1127673 RepID=K6XN23_9ALTE|nr:DUF1501 domain-containing protein [Aliiglaciecola lipolytica]GAC13081.1 hypothetical protein GLIP_0434 [Aliiglaciecola lipolytica E3]
MNLNRRNFIKAGVAGWVVYQTMASGALASSLKPSTKHKKVVWVMLRGAMDSLHGVLPVGDPDFMAIRGDLVKPIVNQLLPLEQGFALHPALKNCHSWYQNQEFSPVVAVASGYRERSHFDGQDQMESGLNTTDHENGWLARAANLAHGHGLAISQTVPIALRGDDASQTWYPSHFATTEDDLIDRLRTLYAGNEEFSGLLESAVTNRDMLEMNGKDRTRANFSYLAKQCGELLNRDNSANCAMLELNGWDTHNNQFSRLSRQFEILDNGLGELKTGLGESWNKTVVIVTTEFGRTVAINGTKGTDHGTGSAMFLLGGAIKGKQVLGKWPGLKKEHLFANRDLMPTTDVRSWMASVLHQHWGLSLADLNNVFPDVTPIAQSIVKSLS